MGSIAQRMGPKSKRESKRWRKQEKKKLEAIENAFKLLPEHRVLEKGGKK